MINQTDFLDLYGKLGLDSDCGLAEFKRAYRRHVAMLHPDRPTGVQTGLKTGAGPLQELIAQYSAAMEFHRRHGRLPGAAAPPSRVTVPDAVARPAHSSFMPPGAPVRVPPRSRSKLLVVLAMIGTGVLLWNVAAVTLLSDSAPAQSSADEDGSTAAPMAKPVVKPVLSIGMSADGVRAIEGDPLSSHGDRWEYGPSWVSFDEDTVVDWYSSPLHPLHVPGRSPGRKN